MLGRLSRNGETDLSQNLCPSFLHWLLSNKLPLSFRFLICKVEIKIPASKIVRIKGNYNRGTLPGTWPAPKKKVTIFIAMKAAGS